MSYRPLSLAPVAQWGGLGLAAVHIPHLVLYGLSESRAWAGIVAGLTAAGLAFFRGPSFVVSDQPVPDIEPGMSAKLERVGCGPELFLALGAPLPLLFYAWVGEVPEVGPFTVFALCWFVYWLAKTLGSERAMILDERGLTPSKGSLIRWEHMESIDKYLIDQEHNDGQRWALGIVLTEAGKRERRRKFRMPVPFDVEVPPLGYNRGGLKMLLEHFRDVGVRKTHRDDA